MILSEDRPISIAILAVFVFLVALLGLAAAGSYYLAGSVKGVLEHWTGPALTGLLATVLYLVLAWGLWTMKRWVPSYAIVLMAILILGAVIDAQRQPVLDLAAALWFFLAAIANMAVIAFSRIPAIRSKFS